MAFVDDLVLGQIDTDDSKPVNYCTPNAYFEGLYFEGSDYSQAVYQKTSDKVPAFFDVNRFSLSTVKPKIKDFLSRNYSSFIVPTVVEGDVLIGFSHKLTTPEINNGLVAFNDNGILPLDMPEVAQIIRKNHPYLKGTSIVQNGTVNYEAFANSIAVYDETKNIFVYSLVNGARPEFINRLLDSDLQVAYNIVTDTIKVPVNENQFMAMVSLAYDIGRSRFLTSRLVKSLNKNNYESVATYFMEFVEVPRKRGIGVSQRLFDRRNAEVDLFSSI